MMRRSTRECASVGSTIAVKEPERKPRVIESRMHASRSVALKVMLRRKTFTDEPGPGALWFLRVRHQGFGLRLPFALGMRSLSQVLLRLSLVTRRGAENGGIFGAGVSADYEGLSSPFTSTGSRFGAM